MHDNKEMTNKEADEFIKLDKELTSGEYMFKLGEDSWNRYVELYNKIFAVDKRTLPTVIIAWYLHLLDYQRPDVHVVIKQAIEKYLKDIKAPPDKIKNILKGYILKERKYTDVKKLEEALAGYNI